MNTNCFALDLEQLKIRLAVLCIKEYAIMLTLFTISEWLNHTCSTVMYKLLDEYFNLVMPGTVIKYAAGIATRTMTGEALNRETSNTLLMRIR